MNLLFVFERIGVFTLPREPTGMDNKSMFDFIFQVVHQEFGIVEGLMTTVHATTGLSLSLPVRVCVTQNSNQTCACVHFTCCNPIALFLILLLQLLLRCIYYIVHGLKYLHKPAHIIQYVRYRSKLRRYLARILFAICVAEILGKYRSYNGLSNQNIKYRN